MDKSKCPHSYLKSCLSTRTWNCHHYWAWSTRTSAWTNL